MDCFLMRKDEIITLCDFDEKGRMLAWSDRIRSPELAPLGFRSYKDWLVRWWENRKIPLSQGRIEKMLQDKGLLDPGQYLLNNLGLSLTDYYWICPIDLQLKWKDIDLFENDFKEDLISGSGLSDGWKSRSFTPNSSLKGELEKTWVIRNGKRRLIKGNHGELSSESINEVIASEFHKAQGFTNHTQYSLIKIKSRPYDYGCVSDAFTSNDLELVSAYELITSEPREGSMFEQLLNTAEKHGMDKEALRAELEYQIMADYILSNVDRHMENIGFLRDARTLRLVSMAPIFDSGRSLFAGSVVAATEEEFENIQTNSFMDTESRLLDLVSDRSLLDLQSALEPARVEALYRRDSKISEYRIKAVRKAYETKLLMFERFQKH